MRDDCPDSHQINEAVHHALTTGLPAVLVTLVSLPENTSSGFQVGSKLLIVDSGERTGSLASPELDEVAADLARDFLSSRDEARTILIDKRLEAPAEFDGIRLLFERIESEPRLVIAGAGHVGAALARLGALVGYRVTLIDDRSEFVKRQLFNTEVEQGIELVAAEDWVLALHEVADKGRGVSVAIVTRGHKQDEECLRAAIAARPDYIGMIGSKRRTNFVLEKLRSEGASEDELRKVRAPIGLDIGAVSPEEVALAILAEIVAERRKGSGAPLSAWRRI